MRRVWQVSSLPYIHTATVDPQTPPGAADHFRNLPAIQRIDDGDEA